MRAMILAAGLGVRLVPLTKIRPKPLFPVYNLPVIAIIIRQLKDTGVTHLAINTHWLAPMIKDYIDREDFGDINIKIAYEPEILGTAGGIKNFEEFLGNDPFLVVAGDIIHNIDLVTAYERHIKNGHLATLILHNYPPFNQVELDKENNIVGLRGRKLKHTAAVSLLAFTGIHIISPELFNEIPEGKKVDIISCYKNLILQGASIKGEIVKNNYWVDMGHLPAYHQIHLDIYRDGRRLGFKNFEPFTNPCIGSHSSIGTDTLSNGYVSIGKHTHIGKKCFIKNSIIWDRVEVYDNIAVENCIIGDGVRVKTSLKDAVIIGD
ncbi:MAG: sugar phosphate nucleotidyltransferase [Thermodesulfobacteriota bacterium]|nr:sugar phosphate nucleotidyltransferase [Thermodesulfobacteriota bacterium]